VRRREFIAGLGGAALWPLVGLAQQPVRPVIGFLSTRSAIDEYTNVAIPFHRGLKEVGYVEGQNVSVEYQYAENHVDRLPALAAGLVRRSVAVIVAIGASAGLAAKAATTTTSIVFGTGVDPVAGGLVVSLNRPGANIAGCAGVSGEVAPKQLQLLHELIPSAGAFGVLVDPAFPTTQFTVAELQAAARTLGQQLVVVNAGTDSDLETAFKGFLQQRVGAVLIPDSNFFNGRTKELSALAAQNALPAIYPFREAALAGGLMSYGSSRDYLWHRVGIYTGRVLKGEKPADLPVEQPTKFELVVNLTTARALGLTVPETILALADEVIQ
jgi:putative tryptophan/tyrosine transport system substrate-binding protein